MSGFIGILNLDGAPIDPVQLQQMTEFMTFCGPDALDTWIDGNIGFGHTLLRTTFESESEKQPCSLDGQVWITADERLDGRNELIRKLRAKEHTVADNVTDVELILHAYHAWGEACLEHLMGDFAFAIWDSPRQRLFCARDHFGVVPFYWAQVDNTLIFSNTLNCLHLHPGVSDELNEAAIGDFLLFGANFDFATTTFADIRRLPPAHTLTSSDGEMRAQRYWAPPEENDYLRYKRPEEYVEQFRNLFEQAVADRLRTDHAATHLSGGMDSTSVAATAHRVLKASGVPFDLQAYTIVSNLVSQEEDEYARSVAEAIGIRTNCLVAEDYAARTPAEAPEYVTPEPVGFLDLNAQVEALHRAATHSRVLFTGYGGDPGFYPSSSYWTELLKRGKFGHVLTGMWHHVRVHRRRPPLYLRRILPGQRNKPVHEPPPFPDLLNPDFVGRLDVRGRYEDMWASAPPMRGQRGMATAPSWSGIFALADPGFTSVPVKFRFPFFDLRLVRFLLAVPRVPWCINKTLLRVAMQGILPETVIKRPKTPAGTTAAYQLNRQREVPPWMAELAATPGLAPYVDGDRLSELVQNLPKLSWRESKRIPAPLVLAYWLRHWKKPGGES